MVATSNEFKDKPVIFAAVNSGNPESAVEGYARSVGLTWPVSVDGSRAFEKEVLKGEISLRNVFQLRIIGPDGRVHPGNFNDLAGSVNRYLDGAKWKVDPETVPESLKATWKQVEFGEYTAALSTIRRAQRSSDEQTKAAGDALHTAIETELDARLKEAKEAADSSEKWTAYKIYDAAAEAFRGMPKAREAQDAARELKRDDAVAAEAKAHDALSKVKKMLGSRSRATRRTGVQYLDAIAEKFPDTEAGRTAAEMQESYKEE